MARLSARVLAGLACIATGALGSLGGGCSNEVPNPYATSSASGILTGSGGEGGTGEVDPQLGGPCTDDAQCDDGLDCTFDACDHSVARCRFVTDDSLCQNTVFCDGTERCDQKLGCQPGTPHDCGDDDVCTIDTCVESTQSCTSVPRDADGDGDPDFHCSGGGDCNDLDPSVSSLQPEVCGNGIDDDCDGVIDEDDCISPANDTCATALVIPGSGTYAFSTAGASDDYATTCAPLGMPLRDVVGALQIPAGAPVDVIATARTGNVPVAVTVAGQCGQAGSEIACSGSFTTVNGGQLARTRARALGDAFTATAYPIYLTTLNGSPTSLQVEVVPAAPAPTNETCGTALPLTAGTSVVVDLVGAAPDVDSSCAHPAGDLLYAFTLTDTSDVDVYGASIDGTALPALSLRDSDCALLEDEITCDVATAAHIFRHSVPPGDYFVSVSATVPGPVSVDLELSAPTDPPPDESCATAPSLVANQTTDIVMAQHQDDETFACLAGGTDAAYALDVTDPSDVLLVLRTSSGDSAAVELAGPDCDDASLLVCGAGTRSPVRAMKRNVAPGDYRVVTESVLGQDQQLTAFVRPAGPATIVPFADGCADALLIPESGGFFQGNTGNATADFPAGCDNAGGAANGAKDQLLRLDLTAHHRVVLDTTGSGYATMIDVRQGPSCPGTEVTGGCTVTLGASQSYLDLDLQPGTYYVQVDGLGGDAGPWFLNVFVVDP